MIVPLCAHVSPSVTMSLCASVSDSVLSVPISVSVSLSLCLCLLLAPSVAVSYFCLSLFFRVCLRIVFCLL